jgi:hypothetical protein
MVAPRPHPLTAVPSALPRGELTMTGLVETMLRPSDTSRAQSAAAVRGTTRLFLGRVGSGKELWGVALEKAAG